jgi:hypothetical protein
LIFANQARDQSGNRVARHIARRSTPTHRDANGDDLMSQDNKDIVARWFKELWGNPWNPRIVNELATADILMHYP